MHARARSQQSRSERAPLEQLSPAQRQAKTPILASEGKPLDSSIQTAMSARFGHDFSKVRIHRDTHAEETASALDAAAYAVGSDLVFGAGSPDINSPGGQFVLAHELTHVVQNESFGVSSSGNILPLSDSGDKAEAEANATGTRILRGRPASITSAPTAAVSRFGLGDVWDAVTGPVGGILHHGLAGEEAREQNHAQAVQQGVSAVDHGVNWAQGGIAGGARSLAGMAHGIPLLGSLANVAATGIDQATQVTAGAWHGATGLVGGLANMVANPIGTARGLEQVAEHVSVMPGVANPFAVARHAYNAVTGQESVGSAFNHSLNPLQVMHDNEQFMGGMASHMADPYRQSITQGRYGEAIGRLGFDAASMMTGGGEVRGAVEAAEASRAAGAVADAGRAAEGLGSTRYAMRGEGLPGRIEHIPPLPSGAGEAARAGTGADINALIEGELPPRNPILTPGATPLNPADFPRRLPQAGAYQPPRPIYETGSPVALTGGPAPAATGSATAAGEMRRMAAAAHPDDLAAQQSLIDSLMRDFPDAEPGASAGGLSAAGQREANAAALVRMRPRGI